MSLSKNTSSGILRRFNDAGIAEFVRRIEILRAGDTAEIDDAFVNDAAFSEPVVPEVPMERPAFKTKRDAGKYLSERTHAARLVHGDDDRGLWTWLSAWHWEALCPFPSDGGRRPGSPFNYVFGFGNIQNSKKHLLFVATSIYETAPESRLLLDTPVGTLTQVVQEVSTRVLLFRLKGLYQLMDLLYRDPSTGRPKRGIVDTRIVKPGDVRHRLPARIRQLEVTHDLTELTAEQLLHLLGDEFRQWAVASSQSANASARRKKANAPPQPSS